MPARIAPLPPDFAGAAAGVAGERARVVEGEHAAAQFDGLAAGGALAARPLGGGPRLADSGRNVHRAGR